MDQSETSITGRQMPAMVAGRHLELAGRYRKAEGDRKKLAKRNRDRFILVLVLLLIWYFGGPFAGAPVLHYLVQTVGLVLVALGLGTLRVLQALVAGGRDLRVVKDRLIALEDRWGIEFSKGIGSATEVAGKLEDPAVVKSLEEGYMELAENVGRVEGDLERSLFGVYLELFSTIRTEVIGQPKP